MSLNPPQAYRKTEFTHRQGLAADRPAAGDVLVGTLYFSTDTEALERSNGTTWDTYAGAGGGLHASSHSDGAADEVDVTNLGGFPGGGTTFLRDDATFASAAGGGAHATTHEPLGSDPMAVDSVAATGSLRTLGTSSTSACAGNDSRLSDDRDPTLHASTHSSASSDPVTVTNLAGYPGGSTTFLRADATFTAPASGLTINLVVKASDESVANNTLQNDNDISQAVAANETWIAEGSLFITGTTGADFNWSWNAPSGAVGWTSGNRLIGGATGASGDLQTSAIEDLTDTGFRTAGLAGVSAPVSIKIFAVIINGANAGTWQFRWAQVTTDGANPTIVQSGSYMLFIKKA